jgi:hypothetical protein
MDLARRDWQKSHGRVVSAAELLNLLMQDPSLQWLRLLSSKIARLDEVLDEPESVAAEALVREVDELIVEGGPDQAEFQLHYQAALQASADAALLHVKIAHALRRVRGRALPVEGEEPGARE